MIKVEISVLVVLLALCFIDYSFSFSYSAKYNRKNVQLSINDNIYSRSSPSHCYRTFSNRLCAGRRGGVGRGGSDKRSSNIKLAKAARVIRDQVSNIICSLDIKATVCMFLCIFVSFFTALMLSYCATDYKRCIPTSN